MSLQLLSAINVKLVDETMQNAYIYVLFYSSSTKKYHLSPFQRAPCSNISENSGKHFILQGRRVREIEKINKPIGLMLPTAKIALP